MKLKSCVLAAAFAAGALTVSAQQGGTIQGRVRLTGTPPANALIRMGADPNCLTINAGKRIVQETVLKGPDGGLANVFASVRGSFPSSAPPSTPAVIDQRACTYHPRVQGARVGQTLSVKNSDKTLHNIHSMTTKDNAFNTGQPQAGMVFNYKLKSEEVMLHVKCDVHPWMTGYIGVVNHPYHAVTNATGAFTISGVPPGKQTIQVWHERYGALTQTVDIRPGAVVTVDFAYTGSEKPPSSAGAFPVQELVIPAGTTAVQLVFAPPRQ